MKRILVMVLRLFWIAPYWFIKLCKMGKSENYSEEEKFAFLKMVTTRANRAGRVTIKVAGLERVPKENGFIFYPNHQGLYDVLAFLETCPKPFSVIMKKEVANVFLVKQVRLLLKGISLDRGDARSAVKVINQMAKEVKEGRNYIIFAEGTRSRQGNKTGDFKGGSFKAALYARCPIVPVALIDSFKPFDESHVKPVTMEIHYLEPILYEEYRGMKTPEIASMVKGRIDEEIASVLAARQEGRFME